MTEPAEVSEPAELADLVELSGPRGIDYAPPELTSVHGYRYVLHVTLPTLEPASKRRRV